jgi:hypothetical protein
MARLRDVAVDPEVIEQQITVGVLRGWIRNGSHGLKLPTYRAPGDGETLYVDIGEVLTFRERASRKRRAAENTGGGRDVGRCVVTLSNEEAEMAREFARRTAARLGVERITTHDAVVLALQNALRQSERKDS